MISANQLVAHAIGDYVLQSDWMANEKTKRSTAALAHALTYGVPFLLFQPSLLAMVVIIGTHFIIDRWRLARYVCWLKNFFSPRSTTETVVTWAPVEKFDPLLPTDGDLPQMKSTVTTRETVWRHPWAECSGTGYHKDRPVWMSVWLLIICDNIMHVLINALALRYL